jgi:hypothetical protein
MVNPDDFDLDRRESRHALYIALRDDIRAEHPTWGPPQCASAAGRAQRKIFHDRGIDPKIDMKSVEADSDRIPDAVITPFIKQAMESHPSFTYRQAELHAVWLYNHRHDGEAAA